MGDYVRLGAVRAHCEDEGDGEPLVLLHPGGADSRAFEVIAPGLAAELRVYRPDRRGHGRTADVEGPITYELMADGTIVFLEQVVGGPAHLVGHSDGTPVGLVAARRRPDLARSLVLASGVFHHDGWAPGAIDPGQEMLAFFVDCHGAVSPDGPDDFHVLSRKLHRMHSEEPTLTAADRAGCPGPALVMVGDREDEIPIDHTLELQRGLPDAQLAVVPGAGRGSSTTARAGTSRSSPSSSPAPAAARRLPIEAEGAQRHRGCRVSRRSQSAAARGRRRA